MAVGTDIDTGNVIGGFALRHTVIVTARTATQDILMVDPGYRLPSGDYMATLTGISGMDMPTAFACDRRAVVARVAAAGDTRVIVGT
jgi:hypothetical protein